MLHHRYFLTIISLLILISVSSCQDVPEYEDDPLGNFDALARIVGDRYCFFREKDIDWDAVTASYRSQVNENTGQLQLFSICSQMLEELKDGHVNLSSTFNTSYYRRWWTDYPQDFNLRTIQQYYLDFDYGQTSGIIYKMLDDKIGYMYYPSFSSGIGNLNLDYVLAILQDAKGLIIDIRNNGGGLLTNVDILISRFITEEIPGGSIRHKTGPAPDAFSKPYYYTYKPCDSYRVSYKGPIVVLTNRSCYSAANDFVASMKSLPQVTIIGSRTGGGGGLPFSSELPNGWSVRFSASPMYGPDGEITEFGIDPTPGFETHAPDDQLALGYDAILERAIAYLNEITPETY